eukprot:scaffold3229_cov246-Pinguiococcus_pyrenoidosus.AAC.1
MRLPGANPRKRKKEISKSVPQTLFGLPVELFAEVCDGSPDEAVGQDVQEGALHHKRRLDPAHAPPWRSDPSGHERARLQSAAQGERHAFSHRGSAEASSGDRHRSTVR